MSAALRLPVPEDDQTAAADGNSLLRFLTCGSVDDGKSTLLGRLLFDSGAVLDDQLAALDRDSRKFGTRGHARDFALLVDGLTAEREQGITIDVAYRYFSTPRRSFIVADTPGHEQYTRNMATGASTAELAIVLIDARKGVLPQTRRHAYIVSLLGVRHIVLAINKMDLVGFSREVFGRIEADFRNATATLGFHEIVSIPVCAREGDNIATRSSRTPWHKGAILRDHLETVQVGSGSESPDKFRFPVQLVSRPNLDFRGYAGTVSGGPVHVNQPVAAMPGGRRSRIASIVTSRGTQDVAVAGEAVTLTLTTEIDVSRGDVICPADSAVTPVSSAAARVLWMAETPMSLDRTYMVRIGTAAVNAKISRIRHAIDIQSFGTHKATALAMNELALVDLTFDREIAAAPYGEDRALGALILVDRMTNQTVALGTIEANHQKIQASNPAAGVIRTDPPFWRAISGRVLGGVALATLVLAWSRDPALAFAVGVAEIAFCPVLARVPWGHLPWPLWRDRRATPLAGT